MADIKNFGIKGLASDVQMGKSGGRLKYDSANNRFDFTQSDGSTLEDVRLGSVTAGTWAADAIASTYGGLGDDFSAANGVVSFANGVASSGNISLSDSALIDSSSQLPVAQGGTGASTASGARTNLGLGTIATQDADSVSLSGGAIDGVVIGGTTTAAGSFTTVSASGGFTGNLTGDVTGDVTGTVSDISNHDTDALSEGASNLYFTDARARGAISVTDAGGDGSLSYNSTTGVITYTGPSAAEVRAHFSGGTAISIADGVVSLDDTAVSAGDYGSTTAIPVISVDAQGRITSASTAAIATSFDIAGDSGTDTMNGGETLTFAGTANQIVTTVSDNEIGFALADDLSVSNVTVTGTLNSDDITASTVSVDGDAVITGNLTVQGTQTIVESTTISTGDAVVRVNSDGAAVSAGIEANVSGTIESVVYNPVSGNWEASSTFASSNGFEGDLTGDVTGTVSDISNHDTDALSEGSSNLYFTDARARSAISAGGDLSYDSATGVVSFTERTDAEVRGLISVTDAGGDGSLSYNSTTGVITYTGPSATEVRAHFSGGTGISITDGVVDLDDTAVTAGDYGSSTAIPTFSVDAQGRLTAASEVAIATGFDIVGDDGTVDSFNGGDTLSILGGTNVTTATSNDTITVNLDADITVDSVTATSLSGDLTGDVTGSLSGTTVTATGAVTGGTLTDGTASLSGGALTGATSVTASGAVTGGSLTDGTATLSSGALSGATTGDFSGALSADSVAATGAVTGASADFSGQVDFGALSDGSITINGFVDEDNMVSDSATLVPTQQSVKAYVDSQVGETTLTVAGNSGSAAIDLDSETLTISGGTGLTSEAFPLTNTLSFSLDDTAVTAGSYGAADSVATFTVDAQGRLTAAADTTIDITASQVSDFNAAVDAHLVGGTGIDYATGTIDLADTAVTAGDYGSATQIPTFTVDAQGRITAASNVSVSTGFDIAGDNGSNDTVSGGETLTFTGTTGQVETTITDNNVEIGIVDGASIANLSVTGTFTSDDITSSQISIDGDATITGNLTVQGTQTIVESTTVQTADAIFRTNSNGSATDAGFEANTSNGVKQILYTTVGQEWDFGTENVNASTFTGDLTGDVTGTVSDISNHDTDALAEGATNLYYTDARARGAVSVTDAGGDGSLSYDSATGVITYTGPSAAEVRAHFSAGTGVSITDGEVAIGQAVGTGDDVTFNSVTGNLTGDVTGDVTGDLTGNVTFGSLSDGVTSVTDIETAITDVDTAVPTSGAVVEYVANNAGDGLLLRGTFTADSSASSFDVGTMPSVSARTYYAEKIVIKTGTAFSGGSFNHIKVKENGGSGAVIVAADDADAATVGTYIVELDGDQVLTKGQAVTVEFLQADGSTASVPTAGVMTVSVHYNYV